jgi:hypothetical protein
VGALEGENKASFLGAFAKLAALPKGLNVGGNLDLSGTKITAGNLDLSGTNFTALPELVSVGGDLDLSRTADDERKAGVTTSRPKTMRSPT